MAAWKREPHEGEYEIEPGVYVPRVTKILGCINKPALVGWARNTARDNTIRVAAELYSAVRKGTTPDAFAAALKKRMTYVELTAGTEDAADFGTMLHLRVEAEMRRELGQSVTVPDLPKTLVDRNGAETVHPVLNAYDSYLGWRRAHQIIPLQAEVRVISRRDGYAGTVDLIALIDGETTLVDYKTSKAIYPEYRVQVAAYLDAATEMGLLSYGAPGLIARFPKTAGDSFEAAGVPSTERVQLMGAFRAALQLWRGGYGK